MKAQVFPDPPLDLIRQRLAYDPDGGVLRWTRNIGRYIKAGAPVKGALPPRAKVLYVSIGGKKIPAAQIAWFLHHGHWPSRPVKTKDGRPFALYPNNMLLFDPPPLKDTPSARQMREYRKRAREGKRLELQAMYPHIQYIASKDHWIVLDPRPFVDEFNLMHREFGPYPSFELAYRFAQKHEDRMRDIMSDPPKIEDEEAYTATAGPDGARLVDFEIAFWLDNKTGHFYGRTGNRYKFGLRVDEPAERGRYLQLQSRRYPAHNVVWFMNYAEWPDRKAIRHKNGNPNDNRLDNLELRVRT